MVDGSQPGWKRAIKRLRGWPPLNHALTTTLRTGLIAGRKVGAFTSLHLPRTGTMTVALPNGRKLRLWSDGGDGGLASELYWRGWPVGYEPETTTPFFTLAASAMYTVDVGANIGIFSLIASAANPLGHVIALEPLEANFRYLRRNVDLNGMENVHCVRAAACETDQEIDLFHPGGGFSTRATVDPAGLPANVPASSERVPGRSLDSLIEAGGIDQVDLVKLDTEGTETAALRGMLQTLQRGHPHLFCEVLPGSGSGPELEQLLRPLGYSSYLLTPIGLLPEVRVVAHKVWLNHLFTTLTPEDLGREGLAVVGVENSPD